MNTAIASENIAGKFTTSQLLKMKEAIQGIFTNKREKNVTVIFPGGESTPELVKEIKLIVTSKQSSSTITDFLKRHNFKDIGDWEKREGGKEILTILLYKNNRVALLDLINKKNSHSIQTPETKVFSFEEINKKIQEVTDFFASRRILAVPNVDQRAAFQGKNVIPNPRICFNFFSNPAAANPEQESEIGKKALLEVGKLSENDVKFRKGKSGNILIHVDGITQRISSYKSVKSVIYTGEPRIQSYLKDEKSRVALITWICQKFTRDKNCMVIEDQNCKGFLIISTANAPSPRALQKKVLEILTFQFGIKVLWVEGDATFLHISNSMTTDEYISKAMKNTEQSNISVKTVDERKNFLEYIAREYTRTAISKGNEEVETAIIPSTDSTDDVLPTDPTNDHDRVKQFVKYIISIWEEKEIFTARRFKITQKSLDTGRMPFYFKNQKEAQDAREKLPTDVAQFFLDTEKSEDPEELILSLGQALPVIDNVIIAKKKLHPKDSSQGSDAFDAIKKIIITEIPSHELVQTLEQRGEMPEAPKAELIDVVIENIHGLDKLMVFDLRSIKSSSKLSKMKAKIEEMAKLLEISPVQTFEDFIVNEDDNKSKKAKK